MEQSIHDTLYLNQRHLFELLQELAPYLQGSTFRISHLLASYYASWKLNP